MAAVCALAAEGELVKARGKRNVSPACPFPLWSGQGRRELCPGQARAPRPIVPRPLG